jgi:hypothetical protein
VFLRNTCHSKCKLHVLSIVEYFAEEIQEDEQRKNPFGDDGGGEPRVPISNTTVKPSSADGTWTAGSWESRTLPSRMNSGVGDLPFLLFPRTPLTLVEGVFWCSDSRIIIEIS